MANADLPAWTRNATRLVERPKIDVWYKPDEHGPVDGFLIWRGEDENKVTGDTYRLYAIRTEAAQVIAVREWAKLTNLRSVKLNSRVYIRCNGRVPLDQGRTMLDFEIFVDEKARVSIASTTTPETNEGGSSDPIPF